MHVDVVLTAERVAADGGGRNYRPRHRRPAGQHHDRDRPRTRLPGAHSRGRPGRGAAACTPLRRRRAPCWPASDGGRRSPGSISATRPSRWRSRSLQGRTVLLTTSNGTRALLAARRRRRHRGGRVRQSDRRRAGGRPSKAAPSRWRARGNAVPCRSRIKSVPDCSSSDWPPSMPTVDLSATAQVAAAVAAVRYAGPRSAVCARILALGAPSDPYWGGGPMSTLCLTLDTSTLVPVYHPDVDEIVAGRG